PGAASSRRDDRRGLTSGSAALLPRDPQGVGPAPAADVLQRPERAEPRCADLAPRGPQSNPGATPLPRETPTDAPARSTSLTSKEATASAAPAPPPVTQPSEISPASSAGRRFRWVTS